ncbi:MAG: long-chain fatty acid--CoA ligase [Gammaproteobacteria bacterium]|nr:MAG: long-chain fatty acid--CoA ligase [Gammaproteobacteria bacterium]
MPAPPLHSLFESNDHIAVIDGTREHSFFGIQLSARVLAGRLMRLNLQPGDRVAGLLPNSAQAVVAFLAAARAGHSYLPLNTGLKTPELETMFRKCRVQAVLCSAATASAMPDSGAEIIPVDEVLADTGANPPAAKEVDLDPDREFVCLSTSGSTGEPRIVARTAGAVDANARHVKAGLDISADDRFLSVVPFWHANGFSNCMLTPLFSGASIITLNRFLPRSMLEAILEHKPTVVVGSPFVFQALAQVIEPLSDLRHVRAWISSGAAIPEALDARLRELRIEVRQLYGSSETGTVSISSGAHTRMGNVGKPLDGVRVRIIDDDGREVPQGQPGHVQVSGAALYREYIGEPGEDASITGDGFYRMGDLGWQDLEGDLYLTGRSDALINVSGVKVDPLEVQQVLSSMPEVRQSLVFGAKDRNGLEMIKALLVAEGEISTEEVLRYCRDRLAEYKLPRTIEFVDEIPQDLMGKTPRSLLEN